LHDIGGVGLYLGSFPGSPNESIHIKMALKCPKLGPNSMKTLPKFKTPPKIFSGYAMHDINIRPIVLVSEW